MDPPAPARRGRRPNYNAIHSKPLPLDVHPLPAFHPSHPISLFRLLYAYLAETLWTTTRSQTPGPQYAGYYSPETHAVHVTDPAAVRALWEMGFFGKGTLSRSEPSWAEREKARVQRNQAGGGGGAAEVATEKRREARRAMKLERARVEREKIVRQRMLEEGKIVPVEEEETTTTMTPVVDEVVVPPTAASIIEEPPITTTNDESIQPPPELPNEEHLQLTPEEAFFLHTSLHTLTITTSANQNLNTLDLLHIFTNRPPHNQQSKPSNTGIKINLHDPFLNSYITYHHFRSLGWVVRSGVKFGVDWLLYNRGPVFSHAEFAVVVMPPPPSPDSVKGGGTKRDWWWLHCVNRVQSQVLKTVVLCYVDGPVGGIAGGEEGWDGEGGLKALLKKFTVREFAVRRWMPNRSRD